MSSARDLLKHVLYLNLAHRTDRLRHIARELRALTPVAETIERVEAVYDPENGHRGCSASHARAFEVALARGWESVLILEDDAVLDVPVGELLDRLEALGDAYWKVLLLGSNCEGEAEPEAEGWIRPVTATQSTAILAQRCMFEELRDLALESQRTQQPKFELDAEGRWTDPQVLDQLWNRRLLPFGGILAPKRRLIYQLANRSDTTNLDMAGIPEPRKNAGPFRFHLLGLAHLPQSATYTACAFTQKNRKLARMLTGLGHEVWFYGAEGSDVAEYCGSDRLHFVPTHTLADIRQDYGEGDNRFEIGYDWRENEFRHDFNREPLPSTLKFQAAAIETINRVKRPDDFLLVTQGDYQRAISKAVGLYLTVEPGIGYRGSFARFRAFESSYIQNFTYGSEAPRQSVNGRYYDRVIPNFFDPADVEYSARKGHYFVYLGRLIDRKGVDTAAAVANHLKTMLLIAGQGGRVDRRGHLVTEDGEVDLAPGCWDYLGAVDLAARKPLLAHARAAFVPTKYLEPFAGTHIEAMLSGTPALTTNFGVFPETIPDAIDGRLAFRCNTLEDFIRAAEAAEAVDPAAVRAYAERFLVDRVRWDFERWFEDLTQVYLSTDGTTPGWSYRPPARGTEASP